MASNRYTIRVGTERDGTYWTQLTTFADSDDAASAFIVKLARALTDGDYEMLVEDLRKVSRG